MGRHHLLILDLCRAGLATWVAPDPLLLLLLLP
jgi:hypothetical protein